MRKFIMSLTTVASLSLAAVPILGLTQAANAAERELAVRVAYGDLDLSNPAQAAVFRARAEAAGESLCRAKLRQGDLGMTFRGCVAQTQREAQNLLPKTHRQALAHAAPVEAIEVASK